MSEIIVTSYTIFIQVYYLYIKIDSLSPEEGATVWRGKPS
jgi:hypothetical protein